VGSVLSVVKRNGFDRDFLLNRDDGVWRNEWELGESRPVRQLLPLGTEKPIRHSQRHASGISKPAAFDVLLDVPVTGSGCALLAGEAEPCHIDIDQLRSDEEQCRCRF